MNGQVINALAATYVFLWQVITSRFPIGENVFDYDWELLIILDACRVDALNEVQNEYEFLTDADSILSIGSTSAEWIHNTFVQDHLEEIQSTSYVTANGFSSQLNTSVVNRLETSETMDTVYENSPIAKWAINNTTVGGELGALHMVEGAMLNETSDRKYYHPDLVTAKAIKSAKEDDCDRLIVHYMQPHAPYIAEAPDRGKYLEYEENPFHFLKRNGEKSLVWESYIDNLRLVLDSVEILLDNIDANKVKITSDHGELFGEWGLYAHIYGIPHPSLKYVPWIETTAENRQTVDPDDLISAHNVETGDETIEERLTNLGYLS